MSLTKQVRVQRWRLGQVQLLGRLAVVIVIGLVRFLLNRHVARVAGGASRHDPRLEDLPSCVRPRVRG